MRRGSCSYAYFIGKGDDTVKFLHLSDLHLGRKLHDISLLEDQQFILQQILDLVRKQRPDTVLIAGDVYDKSVPSVEAVRLLDWFLTTLREMGLTVLMVSGNHDSPERLAFGAKLLDGQKVHISPVFEKTEEPVVLHDNHGEVRVYLLPFVKPIHVRRAFPEAEIFTYTDAIKTVIDAWHIDTDVRNILVAHQFVTGAERSESERISIGGLDDVSAEVFRPFDYVALGHLHRAQAVGGAHICYAGTPLAYSFSEGDREKTVTWIDCQEKGTVTVSHTVLVPRRPVQTKVGYFHELLQERSDSYLRIILKDEEDIPNAWSRLRYCYPEMVRLEYDNLRMKARLLEEPAAEETVMPLDLLERFYQQRNGMCMEESQRAMAKLWMEEIWEDDGCGL